MRYLKLSKIKNWSHYIASISFLDNANFFNIITKKREKTIISMRANPKENLANDPFYGAGIKGKFIRLIYSYILKKLLKKADLCVAVSKGVANSLVPPNLGKKYNISGVPKSKSHKIIYNVTIKYNPFKLIIKQLLPEYIQEEVKNKIRKSIFTKPQMDIETKEYLKNVYKEDILKLQELIGRDLSHWLK